MKKNLVAFAVAAAVLVPGAAFAADSSAKDNGPVLYGMPRSPAASSLERVAPRA